MRKASIVSGTFVILVMMITIILVSAGVYAEGSADPSINLVSQLNNEKPRALVGESGMNNFYDASGTIAKVGDVWASVGEQQPYINLDNAIGLGEGTEKNTDWEMLAFLTAIVGAGALSGMGTGSSKNAQGDNDDLGIKRRLDDVENGIWIDEKDREKVVSDINKSSARKYKVDELGYLIQDYSKPLDPKGSLEASNMIDSLIDSNKKIIVSTQNTFDRINPMTGEINKIEIKGGITIGSDNTGYAVFVSDKSDQGIELLHELAHANGAHNSAVDIENKIRSELGMAARANNDTTDGLFYDNYNEGEGYIDELASKTGATLSMDQKTGTIYSALNGVTGQFNLNSNGTYIDPAANRLVVKEKEFKFQMNMDLAKNEVYLRTEINKIGGTIDWVAGENKAVVAVNGKTVDIKVGEHGTKIVNDRIVIDKVKLAQLLDMPADATGADGGNNAPTQTTEQGVTQGQADQDFTPKTENNTGASNMSVKNESVDQKLQQSNSMNLSYESDNSSQLSKYGGDSNGFWDETDWRAK